MEFFYNTAIGRFLANILFRTGILSIASKYFRTKHSTWIIDNYIKNNNIDMEQFEEKEYESFADFFIREKKNISIEKNENVLISPCDSFLSMYNIGDDSIFTIKGIPYSLDELLPDGSGNKYKGGMCLVYRLEARDFHHFCFIDNCSDAEAKLIPGKLHSVQPIAIEKVPVFRQNRRYYHEMKTENFGDVMQIEVGAVLVGDVYYEKVQGKALKGQRAGHFELCGSTIMQLFTKETMDKISIYEHISDMLKTSEEIKVEMGQGIGVKN